MGPPAAFVEYAQARGFHIDPTRVRHPKDKPRVERAVPFARNSFFAGEQFIDLVDAQRRAEEWCRVRAGLRVHGTTQQRPAEVFAEVEQPKLLPAPTKRYDLPLYSRPKVHRDHHVEVAKALYSLPGNLIGAHLDARADRCLVRLFHRGQLVKVHPRMTPGQRSTDPADLPSHKTADALRDLDLLQRTAAGHGEAIGVYAAAVGQPAAMDEDAAGLRTVGPGEEVGCRPRRDGLPIGTRSRSHQRGAHRPHARTRHRRDRHPTGASRHGDPAPLRPHCAHGFPAAQSRRSSPLS